MDNYEKMKDQLQADEMTIIQGKKLDKKSIKFIQERLYKMIDYTVKRQDWYADQCHRLLQIGLGLVASGVAIIALFIKADNLPTVSGILGWAVGLSIFFTGLRLVYIFNKSLAGDYPYRKVANIKSWYFAYHFKDPSPQNLSKEPDIAEKQVLQEAEYIGAYFTEFLSVATDKLSVIREDIEQVSVLLLLQKYKHKQTKDMASSLSKGLIFTTVFVGLLMISLATSYFDEIKLGASSPINTLTNTAPNLFTTSTLIPSFTSTLIPSFTSTHIPSFTSTHIPSFTSTHIPSATSTMISSATLTPISNTKHIIFTSRFTPAK